MAQISFEMPDGSSQTATVDDGIKSLPPEQQAAFVNHIRETALAAKGVTPGGESPNDSFGNDLKSAAGTAMSDAGSLAQGAGSALGSSTLTDAGSWLRSNAPQPAPGYTGRGGDFTKDIGNAQYLRAGGDLLHGAASGSAESLAELGAGAVGGAMGGPLGAAAGAGLAGGAFSLGRGGRLRAGQNAVSGSDLAAAAPSAALDAGVDAVTMGRLPGGMLTRAGAMGAGGAVHSANDQYDATGRIDPSQVVNDAASGAATGALAEAVPAARNAGKGAVENIMSRSAKYQPGSDASANVGARVMQDLEARKANASNVPGAPSDWNSIANSLKSDYSVDARQRIADISDKNARMVATAAYEQALRHNNTTSDDLTSALGQLDRLDHGLSDEQAAGLKDRLMDLNAISRQSFKGSNVGPLQSFLGAAGRYSGIGAGFAADGGVGAAIGLLAGHSPMGNVGSKIGGGIGSLGDRMLGTSVPPAILAGLAAKRYLKGADVAPVTPFQATPEPAPPAPEPTGPYGPSSKAPAGGFGIIGRQQLASELLSRPGGLTSPLAPIPRVAPPEAPGLTSPLAPIPRVAPPGAPGLTSPVVAPPRVAPPGAEAPPSSPYGNPGKAPPFVRVKVDAPEEPAINPDTGNPVDPIPVNTRIKGKAARLAQATAAQDAPQPAFKEDTAATIAQAMAADPTLAAAARTQSPGSIYLQRGLGISHDEAIDLAHRSEAAGVIPQGAASVVSNVSATPSHPSDLAAIKDFHRLSQGFPKATTGPQLDAQGQPIRSVPAYQAAHGAYHSTAQALAQQAEAAFPGAGGAAVLQVAATHGATRAETVALKRAEARQLLDKLPPEQRSAASAYLLADSLINHG